MSVVSDHFAPDATNAWFATTQWTLVLAARELGSPSADQALEALCRNYWRPLYGFVRRRGYGPAEAQDLTQEFFARLLAKNYLHAVDPARGKFRSFLLAAVEHFLANEWRRGQTQKRGGAFQFVSLEQLNEQDRACDFAAPGQAPEKLFDRDWAAALLQGVLQRLETEFGAAGKAGLFENLKGFLTSEKESPPYAELAAAIGTTVPALKMAVSRMRHRYAELLREAIAATVSTPEQVEEELQALFAALSF
jgi:RNA polymerase sigma-70 factor (ECF subfamily)